jgi:hypothetical protein
MTHKKRGVSINGDTPKWKIYTGKPWNMDPKMDGLGAPSISGNIHICIRGIIHLGC